MARSRKESRAHPAQAEILPGTKQKSGSTFRGEVHAVKARIRLIRSFDEVSHQYQGYVLCLNSLASEHDEILRVAIGPVAHEKHQFQIGDFVSGRHSL